MNKKNLTLALDVWPEKFDPLFVNDYSDLAISKLLNEPLLKNGQFGDIRGNKLKIKISESNYWSNGEKIVSNDYVHQQKRLLSILGNEAKNIDHPLLRCQLRPLDKNWIEIESYSENLAFNIEMLKSHFFTPFPHWLDSQYYYHSLDELGFYSGSFKIKNKNEHILTLVPNNKNHDIELFNLKGVKINFILTKTTREVLALFNLGELDITCPSQFFEPQINEFLQKHRVLKTKLPLLVMLKSNVDHQILKTLKTAVEKLDFKSMKNLYIDEKFSINKRKNKYNKSGFDKISAEVIYSNYYPNRKILEKIQLQCIQLGLNLKLKAIPYRELISREQNENFEICFMIKDLKSRNLKKSFPFFLDIFCLEKKRSFFNEILENKFHKNTLKESDIEKILQSTEFDSTIVPIGWLQNNIIISDKIEDQIIQFFYKRNYLN